MSQGADAALYAGGVRDSTQGCCHHVAMLESGNQISPALGVVAKPMQKLGKAPLGRVNPAAPLNRLQSFLVGGGGDFSGFPFGTMVAPEIVFVEGMKSFADRDYR